MLLTASQATPQGPRGFSFALMSTASLGWGCEPAWASIGSVTMRYPTAAADAAATEICRKERRERQAGFSSAGTVTSNLPLGWSELTAEKLPRTLLLVFANCTHFLASVHLRRARWVLHREWIRRRKREDG